MKALSVIVWTVNVAMVAATVKLCVELADVRAGIAEAEAEYENARVEYAWLSGGAK